MAAVGLEEKYDAVKQLIAVGKERGYLLYDEVNDSLPAEVHSSEEIDDLLTTFERNGIEIYEDAASAKAARAVEVSSEAGDRDAVVKDDAHSDEGGSDLDLTPGLVVLTGENGAGKTNLMEAISLLSPGRGLRRAELGECARAGGNGTFAVSVEITTRDEDKFQLGTGTEIQPDGSLVRRYRLNREPVTSIRSFADYIRIVWLTPAMDGLFSGSAGERQQ